MTERATFYFGCNVEVGHYLFECKGGRLTNGALGKPQLPAVLQPAHIDGRLTPRGNDQQGAARLHHIEGYTVLAWHDYTIDRRGNSNSVFIVEGNFLYTGMLELAKQVIPSVMQRQPVLPFLV